MFADLVNAARAFYFRFFTILDNILHPVTYLAIEPNSPINGTFIPDVPQPEPLAFGTGNLKYDHSVLNEMFPNIFVKRVNGYFVRYRPEVYEIETELLRTPSRYVGMFRCHDESEYVTEGLENGIPLSAIHSFYLDQIPQQCLVSLGWFFTDRLQAKSLLFDVYYVLRQFYPREYETLKIRTFKTLYSHVISANDSPNNTGDILDRVIRERKLEDFMGRMRACGLVEGGQVTTHL